MMRIVEVNCMVYLTSGILSMTCILCAQVTGKLMQGCTALTSGILSMTCILCAQATGKLMQGCIAIVRLTTCGCLPLDTFTVYAWSYCLVLCVQLTN